MDARTFEAERGRLFAIAYRMVGTVGDAEDIVQDSFLRFHDVAAETPKALLTTIVVRLCLDHLKSARVRRVRYEGIWLPEPLPTDEDTIDRASIATAFLLLLQTLSSEERATYILCEVFDYSHDEVAQILEKRVGTCRQLLRRARARVGRREPRFAPTADQHQVMLAAFVRACTTGDLDGLRALLAHDVRARADGGGKTGVARNVIVGSVRVARYLIRIARELRADASISGTEMNGAPALVLRGSDGVEWVVILELESSQRIAHVHIVLDQRKLAAATARIRAVDGPRAEP